MKLRQGHETTNTITMEHKYAIVMATHPMKHSIGRIAQTNHLANTLVLRLYSEFDINVYYNDTNC